MPKYIVEYVPANPRNRPNALSPADWPVELDRAVGENEGLDVPDVDGSRGGEEMGRFVPVELSDEQAQGLRAQEGQDSVVRVYPDPPIEALAGCGPLPQQGTEGQLLQALGLPGPQNLSDVLMVFVDTGINLASLHVQGRNVQIDPNASYGPSPGNAPVSHGSFVANCALALSSVATIADAQALPQGGGNQATLSGVWYAYQHLFAQLPALLQQYRGVVVNNSWGITGPDSGPVAGIVSRFYRVLTAFSQANVDLVFAAGNCGTCPAPGCPGNGPRITGANSFDCVLCVGAMAWGPAVSPLSSYGPGSRSPQKPDVVAPSDFIGTGHLSGFTSAASGVATGVVAEFRTRYPHSVETAFNTRARARLIGGAANHHPLSGFGLLRRIP